jgi:hypothetical protein
VIGSTRVARAGRDTLLFHLLAKRDGQLDPNRDGLASVHGRGELGNSRNLEGRCVQRRLTGALSNPAVQNLACFRDVELNDHPPADPDIPEKGRILPYQGLLDLIPV